MATVPDGITTTPTPAADRHRAIRAARQALAQANNDMAADMPLDTARAILEDDGVTVYLKARDGDRVKLRDYPADLHDLRTHP